MNSGIESESIVAMSGILMLYINETLSYLWEK